MEKLRQFCVIFNSLLFINCLVLAYSNVEASTLLIKWEELEHMLGDDAVKEEFEQFNDVNPDLWIGPELYIYDDVLDSSTLIDDRTGWVVEGVSFSSVSIFHRSAAVVIM